MDEAFRLMPMAYLMIGLVTMAVIIEDLLMLHMKSILDISLYIRMLLINYVSLVHESIEPKWLMSL